MNLLKLTGLILALTATGTARPAHSETARPNIVLIVVDDAAFMDFGAYGG